MFRKPAHLFATLTISLFGLATVTSLCPKSAYAQHEGEGILTTIQNPGGGEIVYGPLPGEKSLKDGMAFILKQVHGHYGDRPTIGKVFQIRGGEGVGTFFTLNAKYEGNRRIAGMVIVSMPKGTTDPVAAVLTDEASHFSQSINPMFQKLTDAWHGKRPESSLHVAKERTSAPSLAGKAQALHQTTFPDNTGSIGLPSDWKITGGGVGSVHAEGPKGDAIHLGVIVGQIFDPRVPAAQQSLRFSAARGQQPLVCYYGGDLAQAWQTVVAQNRQKQHLPPASIKIIDVKPMQPGPFETAVALILADVDLQDGKGTQLSSIRVGQMKLGAFGQWSMTLSSVIAPESVADAEWPTLGAMFRSWRQNGQEIQKYTDATIGQIHEIGRLAKKQADQSHALQDAHNASVEKMWDNQDKYSKSFENIQLDQTVVQDNDTGEHATVYNCFADSLVRHDPNRFQYVNTPDYLKGKDY